MDFRFCRERGNSLAKPRGSSLAVWNGTNAHRRHPARLVSPSTMPASSRSAAEAPAVIRLSFYM
jgi:hypothetical protein